MPNREYPDQPIVGVGGVVISGGRVLLARRGTEPMRGEWSIPGGRLEVGETLTQGVARELREETGLTVRVLGLIEALERIFFDQTGVAPEGAQRINPVRTPQIAPEGAQGIVSEGARRVSAEGAQGVAPVGAWGKTPEGAWGIAPEGARRVDPSLAPGRDLEGMSSFDEGAPETRIARPENPAGPGGVSGRRPKYHYVILDYLCEVAGEVAGEVADEAAAAEPRPGGDVTEVAFVREEDLASYRLNPKTLEVIAKAFAMARARARR